MSYFRIIQLDCLGINWTHVSSSREPVVCSTKKALQSVSVWNKLGKLSNYMAQWTNCCKRSKAGGQLLRLRTPAWRWYRCDFRFHQPMSNGSSVRRPWSCNLHDLPLGCPLRRSALILRPLVLPLLARLVWNIHCNYMHGSLLMSMSQPSVLCLSQFGRVMLVTQPNVYVHDCYLQLQYMMSCFIDC